MSQSYFNDKQQREVFHYLFLERLLRVSEPKFYVLKGGVNLRFFLNSPRYSEDMDIDVFGGSVQTLKKNGYKILSDPSFLRQLRSYGVRELLVNDPFKTKQTQTTQRFRLRLKNQAGEEFPTKVEFSRRNSKPEEVFAREMIHPEIARTYKRISYPCQHYTGESAAIQKIRALAYRKQLQVRDVFDLFILYNSGYLTTRTREFLTPQELSLAAKNLMSFSYLDYEGQVLEYLPLSERRLYEGPEPWEQMQAMIMEILSSG